ncbi:transcriptional regulator, MarR family [Segniliparus rotundus DSM 44985]|uniref:Transcriptional regulator, MarR family n=1 Tax=Segniliparus rotundus (strain ATCC BAA-972 / CDC 1076 / CIP 108378 / DSM 44985 / JCM 13578) TaxID=640132 RepID=D6ZEI4_SEGRD|nr:MarR family transcriptional regulator [Segniliparus rotundus]ADG99460.1 transcriptional regulator, MarR family [Segniliparus rotundus DSM 44985]
MSTRIGNDPGAGFIPPRWLDEREAAAWRGFLDMRAVLMARLGRELQRRDGLSESDYGVLVELSEAAEPRLRPGELAARLGWEKSRLSRQVARMQRRGLVRRDDCPADGRGAFVVLARAGREAVERAAPRHVRDVRRWFVEALAPDQLDAMAEISAAVLRRLREDEAEEGSPASGTRGRLIAAQPARQLGDLL